MAKWNAAKLTGAVFIKWSWNNSPTFDQCIIWPDVQSIVSVNDWDVSVLSPANLKPGDTIIVQHVRKHNKPGRYLWKAVVMDKDEVTEAQAVAQLPPMSFSQGSEAKVQCSSVKQTAMSVTDVAFTIHHHSLWLSYLVIKGLSYGLLWKIEWG